MSLTPGTRLGPYEITAAIGAGGMGEVYRATDSNLKRSVAIKVLPASVAGDADRLARFQREAEVLAALNHPNIAAIYGLEKTADITALVMELVEGDDLSAIIAREPIALADALAIARQIVDALEAAHEQGIVHRDLKPQNIKVRADGTVKVLDFGLAKALAPAGASAVADAMNSPTITAHGTQMGMILGTAAYMSPEQAKGRAVDKRADIWAFGVVLYEMLTGRRAFAGENTSDILASVLKTDPDWTALDADVPLAARRLLRRCLEKDPKRRLDSAVALRLEIEEASSTSPADPDSARVLHPSGPVAAPRWTQWLPWAVAVIAAAIAAWSFWQSAARERPTQVYAFIDAPANYVLGDDDSIASLPMRTPMVFTPDGLSLIVQAARAGKTQLFLRSLDRADAEPIAGTDDAHAPFVSPDGKWVGFWSAGEIRKVPIEGGTATVVCPLVASIGPFGAAWGIGDVIVFGDQASGRIMRVPAGGGTPVAVTASPQNGRRHVLPFFFPDAQRILFSDVSKTDANDSRLMLQSLSGDDARLVMASAVDGRLLTPGSLVFMRLGTLMTAAFDVSRAEVTGDAVVAMGQVMQSALRNRSGADNAAAGMFAISSLGTLALVRGGLIGVEENRLIWVTPDGRATSAEPANGAPVGRRGAARISPDRSRAFVSVLTPTRVERWLADWTRDTWTKCDDCMKFPSGIPRWSPEGKRLLFANNDSLVAHTLDRSAPDQVLVQESGRVLVPSDWLPDGRIVYQSSPDLRSSEIKLLELGGQSGRVLVPLGPGTALDVSPDGRWLAYEAAREVMVQEFPGPGATIRVSSGGFATITGEGSSSNPSWSPDGRTLYYLRRTETLASAIVAVDIAASPGLAAGKSRELFRRAETQNCTGARCYDVSANGPRFLLQERTETARPSVTRMDFVLNWTAGLKK